MDIKSAVKFGFWEPCPLGENRSTHIFSLGLKIGNKNMGKEEVDNLTEHAY